MNRRHFLEGMEGGKKKVTSFFLEMEKKKKKKKKKEKRKEKKNILPSKNFSNLNYIWNHGRHDEAPSGHLRWLCAPREAGA